ncbi:hypothetical protein [Muriicola sp. Z0-33]|uniref:hypothetical protein n=1 Tax=Muriicola sp. Z0-33 TaxID=2816957 RepID=UPI002237DD2B|nr:hypothetical protein [Muriicola sp. Z0-33]MCW5515302.1 hypothetical protein [Muriicola sp. Z0-33]
MYLFRLIIVFALLTFDLSSNAELITPTATTTEIAEVDPCLLGSWRVDIPSMAIALDRPVSGSILITFERSPLNEITSSFDVTLTRRPPQSSTKRRVHIGSLSATMEPVEATPRGSKSFMLTRIELGEENSHKRYKADGDYRDLDKEEIKDFFMGTVFYYKDCSPTLMIGLNEIKLVKETY